MDETAVTVAIIGALPSTLAALAAWRQARRAASAVHKVDKKTDVIVSVLKENGKKNGNH